MNTFGYAVTFKDGTTNTGVNVKAESERELFKWILNDHFNGDKTIVSITVVEKQK